MTTQGRRVYCNDNGDFFLEPAMRTPCEKSPGDYWNYKGGWYGVLPNGLHCNVSGHTITEHDDGSITVSPSILTTDGQGGQTWHGYLRNGFFESC